jgi:hypothetical protein
VPVPQSFCDSPFIPAFPHIAAGVIAGDCYMIAG